MKAFLSVLLVSLVALSGVGLVHASSPPTTISVGTEATGVAYNPTNGGVYVVQPVGGSISVISDSNSSVVTQVTGLTNSPQSIAYDSGKGEMYVCESGGGNGLGGVDVINASNKIVANIPFLKGCTSITYDSGKGELWVNQAYNTGVSVISDISNAVVENITTPSYPNALAYDPATGDVYVTALQGANMWVMSDKTNSMAATISLGTGQGAVAYDSGLHRILVENSSSLSEIAENTRTVVSVLNLYKPGAMAYDSGAGEMFVINGNDIAVILDRTNSVSGTLSISDGAGLAYDSAHNELFISTGYDFSVLVVPDSSVVPTTSSTSTTGVVVTTTTTTQTSTTPSSGKSGGGVPEFPYQLLTAAVFTALIAVSYLAVRTRGKRQ